MSRANGFVRYLEKNKGSDFVRNHVFNKHAEKIDEVEYFNNYFPDLQSTTLIEVPHAPKREKEPGYSQSSPSYRS